MDIGINIIITLVGALIGAALSVLIPIYLSYRRYGKGPIVTGQWVTSYQEASTEDHPWVREDIKFELRAGKLHFATYNNVKNDEIEGEAEIVGGEHIVGRWRQKENHGADRGVLMLSIAPNGKLMYGFWTGMTETGERRFGGWVHARNLKDLDHGKKLLNKVTAGLTESRD